MRVSTKSFLLKVTNIQTEVDDYISIYFEKPKDFSFSPGDCFDLLFQTPNFTEGRIFSFSSSPTESELRITFRKGITEYKKKLEISKRGDIFLLNYYGSQYSFFLERPLIFYAGGIGIAVFRSILKMAIDTKSIAHIKLIYINKTDNFPFKNELELWRKKLDLEISYISTQSEGRLDISKIKNIIPDITNANYVHYIAGPPLMVDATVDILGILGISDTTIHTDSFDGYFEEFR